MSVTCDCSGKTYSLENFERHVRMPIHLRYVASHPDQTHFVTINCFCGSTYRYEDVWHHVDRKRVNSSHQVWQKDQPEGTIGEVLIIAYCDAVVKYRNYVNHRDACPICLEAKRK